METVNQDVKLDYGLKMPYSITHNKPPHAKVLKNNNNHDTSTV